MSILIFLCELSEMRIKERMCLSPEEVLVRLKKEIFDEVKTVETDGVVEMYAVMWDDIAFKPFLLIMAKENDEWTLISVYETYENHFRRDDAAVRLSHIFISRRKCCDYLARAEAKRQKQLIEDEMARVVHLDIKVTIFRKKSRHKTKEFRKIVSVSPEEYEGRLKSDPLLLLNDAMNELVKQEVDYPEGVQFIFEVYNSRPSGRFVIYKGML